MILWSYNFGISGPIERYLQLYIALHLDQKVDRRDHTGQIGVTKKSAKRDQKQKSPSKMLGLFCFFKLE
ncbi:hypothetical protein PLUTE_a5309 [Pseudoalteromonas luteoviolacea DSM 6061]|nr:hypothetical protein [Pseudoalteromonas luteoviolacea DSM 6061]